MRKEVFNPWQSFSDLAMGLMAVFILVLLTLLWQQQDDVELLRKQKEELERDKKELEEQKRQLEREKLLVFETRKELARLFKELVLTAKITIDQQDNAQRWIARLFERTGCQLTLDADNRLRSTQGQTDLYASGLTELSIQGQANLASCRDSFRLLACALGARPESQLDPLCVDTPCALDLAEFVADDDAKHAIGLIGQGLEAVVLEGNTDRIRPSRFRQITPVGGVQWTENFQSVWVQSFVENAHVGAERARQAAGHLLHLVRKDGDPMGCGPQDLLASRVRIESPSFGRTLAGPTFMRSDWDQCPDDQDDCANARNLSLRIRWTERELRRPTEGIRLEFCHQLQNPSSALAMGLRDTGADLEDLREELECDTMPGKTP